MGDKPFQSAGTFNLVTTAPHSVEVVSTTLEKIKYVSRKNEKGKVVAYLNSYNLIIKFHYLKSWTFSVQKMIISSSSTSSCSVYFFLKIYLGFLHNNTTFSSKQKGYNNSGQEGHLIKHTQKQKLYTT